MHIDPAVKEDLKKYLLQKLNNNQVPQVIIRAPFQLSQDEVSTLKKKIDLLEKADITVEVDSSILAGVIIQFGSSVIDLSINTELQTLAHTLYETV
ncbi:F0F1 ATP synthase subunit delta [Candidatus Roizmanbacteria bacterium]|nr:MAG: F0F1 ATP synthase subunit delta [Candidatus Roizmanbacteria bacterium]